MTKFFGMIFLVATIYTNIATADSGPIYGQGTAKGADRQASEAAISNAKFNGQDTCVRKRCAVCPEPEIISTDVQKKNSEEYETTAIVKLEVRDCLESLNQ